MVESHALITFVYHGNYTAVFKLGQGLAFFRVYHGLYFRKSRGVLSLFCSRGWVCCGYEGFRPFIGCLQGRLVGMVAFHFGFVVAPCSCLVAQAPFDYVFNRVCHFLGCAVSAHVAVDLTNLNHSLMPHHN